MILRDNAPHVDAFDSYESRQREDIAVFLSINLMDNGLIKSIGEIDIFEFFGILGKNLIGSIKSLEISRKQLSHYRANMAIDDTEKRLRVKLIAICF